MLNDAYRTLKDPIARALYVLKQEGFEIAEQGTKDVPPELLEEVFELNMALEELRSGDEDAGPSCKSARYRFESMRDQIDSALQQQFAEWDASHDRAKLDANPRPVESAEVHHKPDRENRAKLMFQIEFENQDTVVGIDLGTTNSLVAWMNLTRPEVIPGDDGDKMVPSVVSIHAGWMTR